MLDMQLKTNNIKRATREVNKQMKWAAKYSIDLAAKHSRKGMEEMAKDVFNVQTTWTGQSKATGFRARNAKMDGSTYYPLKPHGDMTAGAFSGKEQRWAKRQQEGGTSQSNITPVYEKRNGKVNKARGGDNNKFQAAGGVREVFGKKGKKTSRKGLQYAKDHYMKKKGYRGKKLIEVKKPSGIAWVLINFRKKRGDGKFEILFFESNTNNKVRKATDYEKIHKAEGVKILSTFSSRLRANMRKSGMKQRALSVY